MVTIGPLAIPNSVLAGLLGFLLFTILVSLATRHIDQKLDRWSTIALLAAAIVARVVYVILHWETFSMSPMRAFMFWQGGFEWISGAVMAVASVFFIVRSWRSRGTAIGILVVSVLVWVSTDALLNDTKSTVFLPDIILSDADGINVALRDYASGPVVINIWATWCPPCRRELPAMIEQAAASPSIPFLFVNQAEDPIAVHAFLKQQKLTLDYLIFDKGSALARELHTVGMPITLFFYDGVMMDMYAGEISPEVLHKKTVALIKNK
ncbi:TlpA family protein disulfide reductase [Photobacterium phosphoreum]|uniref:TlpA family protein disulfide reductase n=1 Tax=Photobacterium phosphoreum TaxID=659 RepID=UPI001E4142A8|nr:TlpA disulfide reductase family protein [Photobacterium phosphoreum]